MNLSAHANAIAPFYVMEIAKAARALANQVRHTDAPMIFLNIGEPDFTAPPAVQAAAAACIANGLSQYTPATGLPALRQAISHWYTSRYGLSIEPGRIIVTSGASAALQLACLASIDAGDEYLMPDPSYPCNRHFVTAAGGKAKLIASTAAERFQLSLGSIQKAWSPATKGIVLASPSNPTGTSIDPNVMQSILAFVQSHNATPIVDEIYLPLSFDERYGQSVLALTDQVISINSFSKYFNMTGWRLGWLVAPLTMVPIIEKLAQHLYICASTISQHAALACFAPDTLALYERRREEFRQRRDYFVPALQALGFEVPVTPDGAFYVWADCTRPMQRLGINNSWDFAFAVMEKAHIVVTPGRDFGQNDTSRFVRFSTANSLDQLRTSIHRLQALLASDA